MATNIAKIFYEIEGKDNHSISLIPSSDHKFSVFLAGCLLSQINLKPSSCKTVYIYAGPGASSVAINHTIYSLKQFMGPQYTIQNIDAHEVKYGDWKNDACLFIMPGGADILYARALKGMGNQHIQSFVHNGGCYLGICAGAYYGSRRLLFAQGTSQEIASGRELDFFPDTAQGPTLKPWDHKTNSGADAALIAWTGPSTPYLKNHLLTIYYNGGGHFVNAEGYSQVTTLAKYITPSSSEAAIVDITVGNGRAILSGVHCEFAPELLDMTDPFLAPLKEKLLITDHDRSSLMINLLQRLNINTIGLNSENIKKGFDL